MAEENQKSKTQKIVKKRKPNFQRTKYRAYVKLGAGQKSKRRYKKATGRHNKIREKRKGRPRRVEIGYKNDNRIRNLINGKVSVVVNNLQDLANVKENQLVIIGKIGDKKKLEFIKEIEKRKLEVINLNIKKFKKMIDKKMKLKQEKKKKISSRKEKGKKSEKKKESEKPEDKTKDNQVNKDKEEK